MTRAWTAQTFWLGGLSDGNRRNVVHVINILEELGVGLGAPYSSALNGTNLALRELRPKAGRSPLRIIYAFAPQRAAVILLGGDKSSDTKFYKRIIEKAERIWTAYLDDQRRKEGRK